MALRERARPQSAIILPGIATMGLVGWLSLS